MASEFKNYIKEDFDLSDYMLLETFASLGEVLESTALSTNDDKIKNDKYSKIKEKSKQYFEKLKEAINKLIKKIIDMIKLSKEFIKTANGYITIHDWDLLTKDWDKFIKKTKSLPQLREGMSDDEYTDYRTEVKDCIESFTSSVKEHREIKKTECRRAYDDLTLKFNIITDQYNGTILPLKNELLTQVAYNFYSLFFTDIHKIVERFGTKEGRKNSSDQLEKVKKQYGDIHHVNENTIFDLEIIEEGTISLKIKQKLQFIIEKIKKLIDNIIKRFKSRPEIKNKIDRDDIKDKRNKKVKISDWDKVAQVIRDLTFSLGENNMTDKDAEKAKKDLNKAHEQLSILFNSNNLKEMSVDDAIEELKKARNIISLASSKVIFSGSDTVASLITHALNRIGVELSHLYAILDVNDYDYKIDKPEERKKDKADFREKNSDNIPKEKRDMKENVLSFTLESFDLEPTKNNKNEGMKKKIQEKWHKLLEAIKKMIAKLSNFLKTKLGLKLKDEEVRVVDWKAVSIEIQKLENNQNEQNITKICDKIEKLLQHKVVMNVGVAYAEAVLTKMTTNVYDLSSDVANSKVAQTINTVLSVLNKEISDMLKQIETLHSKLTKETEVEESIHMENMIGDIIQKGKKKISIAVDKATIKRYKMKYNKCSKEELNKLEKTAKKSYNQALKITKEKNATIQNYEKNYNKFLILFVPDGMSMVAAKKILEPVRLYSCELEAISQLKSKTVEESMNTLNMEEIDIDELIESCDITEDDILNLDLESMTESELLEIDGVEINKILFEEYIDDDWFGYEVIREASIAKSFDEDGKLIIPELNKIQEKSLNIWKKKIEKIKDDKLQKILSNVRKNRKYCIEAKEKKEARGVNKERLYQIFIQFLPLGNAVRQMMGNYDSFPPNLLAMSISMSNAIEQEILKEFKKRKIKPVSESVVEEDTSIVNESTTDCNITEDGYILLDI